jgi:hypothetical protein
MRKSETIQNRKAEVGMRILENIQKEETKTMAGKNDLEERTLRFALAVIEFVSGFPRNNAGDVI